ncbi:hypothetical protein M0R45_017753 [Rubus argutus]|uniref:Uncharacterized protein n=1 Tax=Rubus argutus TaxID=59490 RepID=A0AAW1XXY4_RUBAR
MPNSAPTSGHQVEAPLPPRGAARDDGSTPVTTSPIDSLSYRTRAWMTTTRRRSPPTSWPHASAIGFIPMSPSLF